VDRIASGGIRFAQVHHRPLLPQFRFASGPHWCHNLGMAGAANGPNASSSHTVALVSTALAQDKLAGLSQMLRCIAELMEGLKIASRELKHLVERGFRGEEAIWTSGAGSGIGLWIADNIARAHDGELLIIPANADGLTEVKLLFPTRE